MKRLFATIAFVAAGAVAQAQSSDQQIRFAKYNDEQYAGASEVVVKSFLKRFPVTEGQAWIKAEDGYAVRFRHNNVETCVFLDQQGQSIGEIRVGGRELLKMATIKQLNRMYPNYTIHNAKEITLDSSLKVYIVTLENERGWKVVKVDGEDIHPYSEMVK